MLLTRRIAITPFLKVIIPFVCGILAVGAAGAPLWLVALSALAVYAAAWLLRGKPFGCWYLYGAVFLTGICVALASAPRFILPPDEKVYLAGEVDSRTFTSGRWVRTTANIGFFRSPSSGNWTRCSEKIQLYMDTAYRISPGDKITFSGYINPVDTTGGSYGRLMKARRIRSRVFVTPGNLKAAATPSDKGLKYLILSAGDFLNGRIDKLHTDPASKEMARALLSGQTGGIDKTLKEAYSKTGVIHIMSVSGLHMGFMLLLANLLLGWMPFLRNGHIYKNIAVILFLWLYAFTTDFSPPVIRAAFMCSAAQAAMAASARASGYNILFAIATLMLAVNPSYLYDISFQLSFLAVLSIMFFFPRLYRRRISKNIAVDFVISSLCLTLAAQLGTLPLIAYNFGRIPLLAVLINPVVILTSFVIIAAALLWVLLPLPLLDPVIGKIVSWTTWAQDWIVTGAASATGGSSGNFILGFGSAIALYALLAGMMVCIKISGSPDNRKELSLRGDNF